MKRASLIIASAVATLAACGGKSSEAGMPAADSTGTAPAAAVADTAKPAADSLAKPAIDSAGKAAAAAKTTAKAAGKAEAGDYDRATKPKFTIDEKTGKIDTIRKKP